MLTASCVNEHTGPLRIQGCFLTQSMAKVLCLSHGAIQLVGSSSSKFVCVVHRQNVVIVPFGTTAKLIVCVRRYFQWSCQTVLRLHRIRGHAHIFGKRGWCVGSVGGLVFVSELQVIVGMRWLAFGCTLVSRPRVGVNPARNRIT